MNSLQKLKGITPFLFLVLAVAIASFKPVVEEFYYSQDVELKDVKRLKADIKMNAGQLNLSTHTQSRAALKATFTKTSWKPSVKMDPQNGHLSIHQPSEKDTNMKDDDKNEWQIKIPKDLSTDLKIQMGAGEGKVDLSGSSLGRVDVEFGAGDFALNLSNSSLSSLDVKAGVGALAIDLSGRQDKNLKAKIDGGVGSINLVLPRQVGVRVKVNGLGGLDRNDFKKQDGYYVNDNYGKTNNNIEVTINGGLGSVDLDMK